MVRGSHEGGATNVLLMEKVDTNFELLAAFMKYGEVKGWCKLKVQSIGLA
jgi:hypothetical protein